MRGGGSGSPSMVTVPASTSLNSMGDDELLDDVFEDNVSTSSRTRTVYDKHSKPQMLADDFVEHTPSPTGYRDYKPPAEVLQSNYKSAFRNKCNDYSLSSRKIVEKDEGIAHKTILLGDSGVGKTSLLVQFDTGRFQHSNFAATVGIGFTNKMVAVDDAKVKLQIWDTAGQERFRSVTHAYYRDAHALLLLYDVTNKKSYDNIRAWLGEIREYAHDDVVIMLLGNKCDCGPDRHVQREDGEELAKEYKVPFMETSAKTGMNVELAFLAIARELLARSKPDEGPDATKFNVQDYVLRQQQSAQRTNSPSNSSSCFASSCLT